MKNQNPEVLMDGTVVWCDSQGLIDDMLDPNLEEHVLQALSQSD